MRSLYLFRFLLHLITLYPEVAQGQLEDTPPCPPLGAGQDPSADLPAPGNKLILWQAQLRKWQPLSVYHLIFLSLDVAIINLSAYSCYSGGEGHFGQAPIHSRLHAMGSEGCPSTSYSWGVAMVVCKQSLSWGKIVEDETGVWEATALLTPRRCSHSTTTEDRGFGIERHCITMFESTLESNKVLPTSDIIASLFA